MFALFENLQYVILEKLCIWGYEDKHKSHTPMMNLIRKMVMASIHMVSSIYKPHLYICSCVSAHCTRICDALWCLHLTFNHRLATQNMTSPRHLPRHTSYVFQITANAGVTKSQSWQTTSCITASFLGQNHGRIWVRAGWRLLGAVSTGRQLWLQSDPKAWNLWSPTKEVWSGAP